MIRSTPSVAAFSWLLLAAHAYAAPATEQLQQLQGGLRQARAANDWPAYLATATKLQTFLNAAPRSLLEVSRAQLHVGNTDAALQALSQFAAMGQAADLPGLAQEFATLPQGPALQRLQERMSANARPVALGASALVLADAGLLAEDLDYDRSGKRFLVSSIRERKIVALEQARPQHGLRPLPRRLADGGTADRRAARAGCGRPKSPSRARRSPRRLTGAVRRCCASSCPPAAWCTASRRRTRQRSAIWSSRRAVTSSSATVTAAACTGCPRGGTALQVLNGTDLISPQTPALHPDGRHVFVPDYVRGIAVLDLASGELRWLSMQGRFALNGIDGLYYQRGRLIAVQNGTLPERVVLFTLDPTFDHIVAETVIERSTATLGDPTHGVIVGNDFYYIANSGWDLLDEHGALKVRRARFAAAHHARSAATHLVAAMHARIAREILRQGRRRDVADGAARLQCLIEAEALGIGREHQQSAGRQQPHAGIDELRMVALDVEHAFHALGVRERRRIEEYQVVARGGVRRLLEPGAAVGLHEGWCARRQAVEREVALRPLEVGPRQVHRRAGAPRRPRPRTPSPCRCSRTD